MLLATVSSFAPRVRSGTFVLTVSRSCSLDKLRACSAVEARSLLGAFSGRPLAVRVRSGPRQLAALGDQVLLADRLALEPALEDLPCSRGIAGLGREAGAGRVRGHALPRHRPPGMVLRRRLREPDIPCVAGELPGLERADDRVPVADLAAGGVDQVGAVLHPG